MFSASESPLLPRRISTWIILALAVWGVLYVSVRAGADWIDTCPIAALGVGPTSTMIDEALVNVGAVVA